MRKVHFVQMRLGQTCVGMIHKFVPPEVEDSVLKKRGSGSFFKRLTKLQKIPSTVQEADGAVAKAIGKKLSVKKAPGTEDVRRR
ncbi:MAG: hypothetical protein U9R14_04925 [Patescibacteria group bacterium]|nr:hypothetical protein [Patescibacteria group bacterium]